MIRMIYGLIFVLIFVFQAALYAQHIPSIAADDEALRKREQIKLERPKKAVIEIRDEKAQKEGTLFQPLTEKEMAEQKKNEKKE